MNKKTKTAAKRAAATAALGVGLVTGGAALASATTHGASESSRDASTTATATATPAPPGNPADMAGGVVTAISASSITVRDLSGTSTTYTLTSATTFSDGPTTVDASAVSVGEHVVVELSSTDATTATSVNVMPAMLMGTVTSVSGDTLTITDPQGFTRTIVVDSSTTYDKSGATSSLSDVTVGSVIAAQGRVDTNGTSLDATGITIGLAGQAGAGPGPGPGFAGPGFAPPQ